MRLFEPSWPEKALTLQEVVGLFSKYRFDTSTEMALHGSIEKALFLENIAFQREVGVSKSERIDFLLGGGIGIEVKIDGSFPSVLRQIQGYLVSEKLTSIILFTSRRQLLPMPKELAGKPVATFYYPGGLL